MICAAGVFGGPESVPIGVFLGLPLPRGAVVEVPVCDGVFVGAVVVVLGVEVWVVGGGAGDDNKTPSTARGED